MGEKLKTILTDDDIKRIHVKDREHVEINVHGMTRREAARFIKNIIVLQDGSNGFALTVIHGYNNGHAIKSMLERKSLHPRITEITPARHNPGVTTLSVAAIK